MTPHLSTRAFRFLRKLNRKSGLQHTDEDVHDMGARLLGLCHIATNAKNREVECLHALLTEPEAKALQVLHEQFVCTGHISSARELSRALGYQSSRSGHVLLHCLLSKGVLIKRAGQLTFTEQEGGFEGEGHFLSFKDHTGENRHGDLSLDIWCGGREQFADYGQRFQFLSTTAQACKRVVKPEFMKKWQSDGSQALNYLLLQFLPFNPALGAPGILGSGAMIIGVVELQRVLHFCDWQFARRTALPSSVGKLVAALGADDLVLLFCCDGAVAAAATHETSEGENLPIVRHSL